MEGESAALIISTAVFDISNSGSQTMAFVMALQQEWSPTTLRFQGRVSTSLFPPVTHCIRQ